jgi:hypothetical protein
MPDAFGSQAGPLVAAQYGPHPALRALNDPEFQAKSLKGGLRIGSHLPQQRAKNPKVAESIKKYGFDEDPINNPRLACYHYPEVGFEVIDEQTGNLGYLDTADGRFFPTTDSGPNEQNLETRKPYSLSARLSSESGHPGIFDAPQDECEVPRMELIPQERDNWCAAASVQMLLKHYGYDVPQTDIASFMKIPTNPSLGGADIYAQQDALRHFSNDKIRALIDNTPLGEECVKELLANRPLKNGLFQHATVCAGWKKMDGVVQYLIYDPLPVNKGTIRYQNPYIIYSLNFITTLG